MLATGYDDDEDVHKEYRECKPTKCKFPIIICFTIKLLGYITDASDKPTLTELFDLKVPQCVSDKYEKFEVFLLNDENGDKMKIIKHDYSSKGAESITQEILCRWLKGEGLSVTWKNLAKAFEKIDVSPPFSSLEIFVEKGDS